MITRSLRSVPDEVDAASFQVVRPRLFGIACRVLGSANDADDVVQDAWIRWQGTDHAQVRDPAGFLITMTTRLALTVGQSARVRHEISSEPLELDAVEPGQDPSRVAEQDEALERALLELLEKLSATERAAYLLREAFDYPHQRIAELLELSEANARQIVTRARVRLRGERHRMVDAADHRRLADTFVAAARTGDLDSLERLLAAEIAHHEPLAA
jgi:RNA polymerase sigma-70 factor (ECF subfamily)